MLRMPVGPGAHVLHTWVVYFFMVLSVDMQVHDLWKAECPHAEIIISICVGILIWMLAQFYKHETLLYETEV